jgi:hypothetical protein
MYNPNNVVLDEIPVVVDPGAPAIEVTIAINQSKSDDDWRDVPVQFSRVPLDSNTVGFLPFVVTNMQQHIFSSAPDVSRADILLVYDHLCRIFCGYLRVGSDYWEKIVFPEEATGQTILQQSVRHIFPNSDAVESFLLGLTSVQDYYKKRKTVPAPVKRLLRALKTCRSAPVVYPVSVLPTSTAKSSSRS